MIFLFLLLITTVQADSPRKWENAKGIVERHEFYQNNEILLKPQNSWQALFALTFLDSNFGLSKDCFYYRIPGDEPGKIKIKTIVDGKDCASEILSPGDVELTNISDLRFATEDLSLSLQFRENGRPQLWDVKILNSWKRPQPQLLLSSADYRSPRMTYLASAEKRPANFTVLKGGTLCHDIASDCSERSPSRCRDCESGWQEIPNGCVTGPKICGKGLCGSKDQPACRRGMVWQRKEITFDCRTDSSFAWCAKGLRVSCEGDKAYCR